MKTKEQVKKPRRDWIGLEKWRRYCCKQIRTPIRGSNSPISSTRLGTGSSMDRPGSHSEAEAETPIPSQHSPSFPPHSEPQALSDQDSGADLDPDLGSSSSSPSPPACPLPFCLEASDSDPGGA